MGAAASIEPEVFNLVKAEYEARKAEGVSDEVLFESMKAFIEAKTNEAKGASAGSEESVVGEVAVVEEVKATGDEPAGEAVEAVAVPVEAEAVASD
jgi:hypothetical protein